MKNSTLFKALSVFIAAFPENPTKNEHKSMYVFLRSVVRIVDSPHATRTMRRIKEPSMSAVKSRTAISMWMLANCKLWVYAEELIDEPKLWGPIVWAFLHELAPFFEVSKKRIFADLIYSMGLVLPCRKCGRKFETLLNMKDVRRRWFNVQTKRGNNDFFSFLHSRVNAHR